MIHLVSDNVIFVESATYGDTQAAPVGSRPNGASWVGAQDMLGNVFEWVSSLNKRYPYTVETHEDPTNVTDVRIMRGGSYINDENWMNATTRGWGDPTIATLSIGFRCVRDYE